MYCVKCGVKLQDGIEACPLCRTPVWNPDGNAVRRHSYSKHKPRHYRSSTLPLAIAMTAISLAAIIIVAFICLNLYGALRWGGYVLAGTALFYLLFILPLWFRSPNPVVFLSVDFVGAALLLLYIDLKTGGSWYLSFAFPVVIATGIITLAFVTLLHYIRGGRLFIFGGFFMLLGFHTLLIELFEHITFGTSMFLWSQYSGLALGVVGFFLILTGIVKPLREFFEKTFFI